ncbi:MAG: hypothetical protein J6Y01_08735 [Spirochaetales bacterium]|nr:hypothetical protein [Spirochaetales bacterium]
MKKINIIFISAIVALLIGCNNEMTLDKLVVHVEKDYYYGSILDIDSTFTVWTVDCNGVETHLNYDAKGEKGYAVSGITSLVMDKYGKVPLTFQYIVSNDGIGNYYNLGTILTTKEYVTVIKPSSSEIQSISLDNITNGISLSKAELSQIVMDYKCYGQLSVTLNNSSQYKIPFSSKSWDLTTDVSISNMVLYNKYKVYGIYCDVTSDSKTFLLID